MDADVHESAERACVADDALEHHAFRKVLERRALVHVTTALGMPLLWKSTIVAETCTVEPKSMVGLRGVTSIAGDDPELEPEGER